MDNEQERAFTESDFVRVKACALCGSAHLELIGCKSTIHPRSRLAVRIVNCADCGHWMTDPMPTTELLTQLYAELSPSVLTSGWSSEIEKCNRDANTFVPDSHWVVKTLSGSKPGNFLEIGPGDGRLLRKMRQLGWNTYGVDLGSYANQAFQVVSSASQLPDSVFFDVIVCQDVLEHASDPGRELSIYKRHLGPNALLFMSVPWSESKRAQAGKVDWEMIGPLGHLHYFSRRSAQILLESNGFEIIGSEIVNHNPSLALQRRSIVRSAVSILTGILNPKRWKVLRKRLKNLRMLLRCYPDTVGDQLYIKARFSE